MCSAADHVVDLARASNDFGVASVPWQQLSCQLLFPCRFVDQHSIPRVVVEVMTIGVNPMFVTLLGLLDEASRSTALLPQELLLLHSGEFPAPKVRSCDLVVDESVGCHTEIELDKRMAAGGLHAAIIPVY